VHRLVELDDLADGPVTRRNHHALGAVEYAQRVLPPHRTEGLREYVLESQVLQAVEDPRPGGIGVFLDVEDGTVVVLSRWRRHHEVAGPGRERDATDRKVVGDGCRQHRHRLGHAVEYIG